jgi:hypothetical protein
MKTIIIVALVGIFSINNTLKAEQSSSAFILSEEKSINDIPFNTESIFKSYLETEARISEMSILPAEKDVDDIPFSTKAIAASEILFQLNFGKQLSAESYIDDIPFNTGEIAAENRSLGSNLVTLKEENFVNDIPFDTGKIAAAVRMSDEWVACKPQLSDDTYVDDIPFNTEAVALQYNDKKTGNSSLLSLPATDVLLFNNNEVVCIELNDEALKSLSKEAENLVHSISDLIALPISSMQPIIEANIRHLQLSISEHQNTMKVERSSQEALKTQLILNRISTRDYKQVYSYQADDKPEMRIVITKE